MVCFEKDKRDGSRRVVLQERQVPPRKFCATISRSIRDIFPKRYSAKETVLNWDRFSAVKRTLCRSCSRGSARSYSIISMATASSPVTGSRLSLLRAGRQGKNRPGGGGRAT